VGDPDSPGLSVRAAVIAITGPASVAYARQRALGLAEDAGVRGAERDRLALIVSELASNLDKYAVAGTIVVQGLPGPGPAGIEVIAMDGGPGMASVSRAFVDGQTSGNSLGLGLGTVRRMADEVHVDSGLGRGTIVVARTCAPGEEARWTTAGGLSLAAPGEEVCGDAWSHHELATEAVLIVADGLGHGPDAAAASGAALGAFRAQRESRGERSPCGLLESVHLALRGTRGAAVGIAQLDRETGVLRYCGLGNVSAAVCGRLQVTRLVSLRGVAGRGDRQVHEHVVCCPAGSAVVMHSDGVSGRWRAQDLPDPAVTHPTVIAASLLRSMRRGPDDATVAAMVRREVDPA
jgi:anti-sigma regulatory factor (Ser/Thr protein kinase)